MRRNLPQSDSLDFLLDAMCNVFGAILLVAILVAAISGSAMLRQAFRDPANEVRALREKIALREAELSAAEAELALWESLAAARATKTSSPAPEQLSAAHQRNQGLAQKINELGSTLSALHREHLENERKLAAAAEFEALTPEERTEKLTELRPAIGDLQSQLAAADATPERFTPHVLQTADGLQPWRFLITSELHEVGSNRAIRTGLPESDAVKIEHFGLQNVYYWRLMPVAGAGIAPDALNTEQMLKKAPPERFFMELLCAPGAIAETAQTVRKLRHAGYRVNWRVMPPEGALVAERQGGHYEAAQ